MAYTGGKSYTCYNTDLCEAITVGQRIKGLSVKAIVTTSAVWDAALLSAQSLDCDNEISDDARFQNASEGKEFSLFFSLKM